MYAIVQFIYGVPYTPQVAQAVAQHFGIALKDVDEYEGPYNFEESGWTFLYSGSADFRPGYLGISVEESDEASMPHPKYPDMQCTSFSNKHTFASPEQIREFQALWDKQPSWLQPHLEEPKIYMIWSNS